MKHAIWTVVVIVVVFVTVLMTWARARRPIVVIATVVSSVNVVKTASYCSRVLYTPGAQNYT